MQQLVETSAGTTLFDFKLMPGHLSIWITFFDGEGWEAGGATWHDDGSASLETVIQEVTEVPSEEAARVAETRMAEWRDKGYQEVDTRVWRRVQASLAVTVFLAAAGIAGLAWLLVALLT